MRLALALAFLATPATAWEFTPGLPCLLSHEGPEGRVELSFDPTQPLYSITVTPAQPWQEGSVFSMRFEGAAGLTISTDRHKLADDGRSLTVTDTGFGNVLNGMQFNDRAVAMLGARDMAIPLQGAAGPVAAFRECRGVPLS